MTARIIWLGICIVSVCATAVAQWTALPPDPCIWPYADSISQPANSQQISLSRSFSVFANGKFYVFGGRSGFDYEEGLIVWPNSNRHSHASVLDPVSGTWEGGGVQSQLAYTGEVVRLDASSFLVQGDVTDDLAVDDQIRVESGDGIVPGEVKSFVGRVASLSFDGMATTVTLSRGTVPPTWSPKPGDKVFIVTVVGPTPINNGNELDVARAGEGYQAGNHTMVAAHDRDGDGEKEIYLFSGYPHWTPNNVDVYDPATNSWSRASGNLPGSVNEQRAAGAQVGDLFCWMGRDEGGQVQVYDLLSDTWTLDLVPGLTLDFLCTGQGFPEIGPSGAVYYFGGDSSSKKTVRYDVLQGSFATLAPPPITANQGASVRYGDYVILFGGRSGSGASTAVDAIQVYDTTRDTWFVSPYRLPYRASGVAAGISPEGIVYVTGGLDHNVLWRNDAYSIQASSLLTSGISGVLDLEFHLDPSGVPAAVQVFAPGGTEPIAAASVELSATGGFVAPLGISPGVYDLRFLAQNFLAKRLSSVTLSRGDNAVGTIALLNGDGSGNNQVDLADLNIVLINFAKSGIGDYDGDGHVGLADLNIVLVNFSKQGDN
ncbi:MAG: carboxypeptidase regulatory-like domain-containing protein [Fimbriimonadia bacterium]